MTRGKTPSPAASLHEQSVRQHCRALKMPTVAGQFETLAQAAIREGHGHVQYLDALLAAEIEERERKAHRPEGVVRPVEAGRDRHHSAASCGGVSVRPSCASAERPLRAAQAPATEPT